MLILQIYLGRLVYVASLVLHVFLLIGILRIILIILNNGRPNSISVKYRLQIIDSFEDSMLHDLLIMYVVLIN